MLARTRIWRTMVAIMRDGNLGGAAWQRPQLERNRLSPSRCRFSSWVELAAAVVAVVAESLLLPLVLAAAPIVSNMASDRQAAEIAVLILIICFLTGPAASQTG